MKRALASLLVFVGLGLLATGNSDPAIHAQVASPTPDASAPSTNPYANQPACLGGSPHVEFVAGWNLVDGAAALFAQNFPEPTVYAWEHSTYVAVAPTMVHIGTGYWVFRFSPYSTPVASGGAGVSRPRIALCPPHPVQLIPGQWQLVGNPSSQAVTVTGAEPLYAFDARTQTYVATATLAAGQAAWALNSSDTLLRFQFATP